MQAGHQPDLAASFRPDRSIAGNSEDVIDSRMATDKEREELEIPEGVPVTIVKGLTRDGQHRTLPFIDKVTVAGRMQYGYRFGVVPRARRVGVVRGRGCIQQTAACQASRRRLPLGQGTQADGHQTKPR